MKPGTGYIAVSWVYITIGLCLVLNRLYQRSLRRKINFSDALVVIAWLLTAAQSGCDLAIYTHGAFLRWDDPDALSAEDQERFNFFTRVYYFENVLYYIPLFCIKGALLLFLREITPPALPGIRRTISVGLVITALALIFIEVTFVVACLPLPAGEDFFDYANECDAGRITSCLGIMLHMLTDVYIYLIPFFLLRHLSLIRPSQRLAAGAMFGAGFIVVCLALPTLINTLSDTLALDDRYFMWSFWWSIHEQNMAILVACLPALRLSAKRWWAVENGAGRRRTSRSILEKIGQPGRGELETQEVARSRMDVEVGTQTMEKVNLKEKVEE